MSGRPQSLPRRGDGWRAANAVKTAKADKQAADLAHVIRQMQAAGTVTLTGLAAGLNALCIPAPRGGRWSAMQVKRLLARMEAA
jgi:hypothetical protein